MAPSFPSTSWIGTISIETSRQRGYVFQFSPTSTKRSALFVPTALMHLAVSLRLRPLLPCEHKPEGQRTCGTSENLPDPQTVKLPASSSSSQYTKGSLYSDSSPEAENWHFYETSASLPWSEQCWDQGWYIKHVGEYWLLSHSPQPSGEKSHQDLATTLSCLNIENISIERLQVIKTSNQRLGLRCTNPNLESQEYEKTR
jgi:hypothetical protein